MTKLHLLQTQKLWFCSRPRFLESENFLVLLQQLLFFVQRDVEVGVALARNCVLHPLLGLLASLPLGLAPAGPRHRLVWVARVARIG